MNRFPPSFFVFTLLFSIGSVGGQEFDESFDLWPVDLKIGGTILLANDGIQMEVVNSAISRFAGVKRGSRGKSGDEVDSLPLATCLLGRGDGPLDKQAMLKSWK